MTTGRRGRAANGGEALSLLRTGAFDLVLSDMRMPLMDGPGLYREATVRHPGLARRFVFLTGDSLSAETTEFFATVPAVTVDKPVRMEPLRRAVARALEAARAAPPLH